MTNNLIKPMYVIFEGIDLSGKTTQAGRLHNFLFKNNKYLDIITTREPWNSVEGKRIRQILSEDKDPYEKAQQCLDLYVIDRKKHMNELIFLNSFNDYFIIQDRGKYSTLAYQGAQGISLDLIVEKHKFMENLKLKPDIVFILDSDIDNLLKRTEGRALEKFENKDFLEKVRGIYLKMKEFFPNDNLIYINAGKSIEEVFSEILEHIKSI